jgi:hypothetical protein
VCAGRGDYKLDIATIVHERSGRLMRGDRYQEPKAQSLRNTRGGTANDCMLPLALTAHEKQSSFRVDQERSV